MRILITGTTGFVGRNLLQRYSGEHEVWSVNRRPTDHSAEIVQDLSGPLDYSRFPPQIDCIIHGAGIVGESSETAAVYRAANVVGTRSLLEVARQRGAKHFLLLSSGGVYQPALEPLREDALVAATGKYAQSKWDAECETRSFADEFVVTIARLFFPYGPGQRGRLIPRLVEQIGRGEPISLQNSAGDPVINPIFISDLVEYVTRLVEKPRTAVVNLCGPDSLSIRELGELLGARLGRRPHYQVLTEAARFKWVGDGGRAAETTGFLPSVGIHKGIARTLNALSAQQPLPAMGTSDRPWAAQ